MPMLRFREAAGRNSKKRALRDFLGLFGRGGSGTPAKRTVFDWHFGELK